MNKSELQLPEKWGSFSIKPVCPQKLEYLFPGTLFFFVDDADRSDEVWIVTLIDKRYMRDKDGEVAVTLICAVEQTDIGVLNVVSGDCVVQPLQAIDGHLELEMFDFNFENWERIGL